MRTRTHNPSTDLPRNARAILTVLRQGATSISDIERRTWLSQLTIRRHLDALETSGLVVPAGLGRSNGGRQPRLYRLVSHSRLALAMHLRFPGAGVATIGLNGRLAATRQVDAAGDEEPVAMLERLAHVAEDLLGETAPGHAIGVGVALPGYADLSRGISLRIGRAPAWRDVPVAEVLARHLGLPAFLVHDTAAMALAEYEVGDAQGERHFAFVLAEEGVSAGLFLDGTVYQGTLGNAGLIGHMTIRPDGRLCYCGSRGCVESYASARALAERPVEMAPRHVPEPLPPSEVVRRAVEGREPFRTALFDALDVLGIAIANLAKVLEVQTIFVGGYPATLPERMRARLTAVARAHLQPPLRASFAIRYSQVSEAGLVGAAVPVIHRFLGMQATLR